MQEKSKLVGQESMTAQPIHTQMVLKSLDEVLRLSSIGVVIIKGLGREIVSVGDHKATIDPPMVDFHFDEFLYRAGRWRDTCVGLLREETVASLSNRRIDPRD